MKTPPSPRLTLRGVVKRHEGRIVLAGLDLDVLPGQILGVVGPGGQGKSVLLKHLPRLIAPDSGEVRLDGVDLATMTGFELARAREHFGYLFQNYALFDFMTVGENVAFPLRQERRHTDSDIMDKVRARLTEVGLLRALHQYPRELSGGMKKRVGLARATISDPSVAIYDDPTAGLDPVTSSRIFALIAKMHAHVPGCASIIVSHDLDRMAPIVERWVYLDSGRIHFTGTSAELRAATRTDPRLGRFFAGSLLEGAS
ncbi:MAG TPA: ATP-binding cassette domain-containing protein [Myxococcota bacterium]|nr:ATP-binding cassette domain-containing protein [Myxococcota bacterium]